MALDRQPIGVPPLLGRKRFAPSLTHISSLAGVSSRSETISDVRACAIAAEIYRICSSSDAFGLKRRFEQALEQRCTADFEGKLTAAGQKIYDKVLTRCGQGLETPDGRTTQLAVTVEAKCRAEAAVARSKEYWKATPLD